MAGRYSEGQPPAGGLRNRSSIGPGHSLPRLPFSIRDVLSPAVVTISLEGTTLRVLGCRRGRVEFWLSVAFDPALLEGGFVADPSRMGQAIGLAFRHRNLPTRNVICSLPAYGSAFRSFRIPRIAGHREAVVPREARRLMGIGLERMHLAWETVGVKGGQEQIFAVAVPREPLEMIAQTLEMAGIPPSVVDLKPLALARAVNEISALILNAESNSIDVVMVRDGVPELVHSRYLPGATIDDVMALLVEEADTVVRKVREDGPIPAGTPVILTGEVSTRDGLSFLVESRTGLPAAPLVPALETPAEFPVPRFAVNLGLAMKRM